MFYIFDKYGKTVKDVIVAGPLFKATEITKLQRDYIAAEIYEVVYVSEEGHTKIERALDNERNFAETLRTGLTKKSRGNT